MKNKHPYLLVLACALATALMPVGQLSAQTVTSSLTTVSPSLRVYGMLDGDNVHRIRSGVMQFEDFEAFCIDPYQGVVYNQPVTYDVELTFSTADVSEAIAHLVGGYYVSGRSNLEAAATQWAIWEVIVDGTRNPSLTTGDARVFSEATRDLGQRYLDNLDKLPKADVMFLTHSEYQDVVTLVPEPSSVSLLGLGVAGFLLRRRRI